MSERWERVTSLFAAARVLDPPLRGSFLETACANDGSLRKEVEALLSTDAEDDGFLEDAPWTGRAEALMERSPAAGQVLKGRYRVEEWRRVGRRRCTGQVTIYWAAPS